MDQPQFCFECGYAVDTPNHECGCLGQFPVDETEVEDPSEDAVQEGLPPGLVITADGSLLNWKGENYVRQPEPDGTYASASLEVLTGFTVAVGRNGRPLVLPLDLRGVFLDAERVADNRDIQAACREISDDLLAHRASEYSETLAHMEALTDILGEIASRIPEKKSDPNIEKFQRRRGQ